MKSDKFKEITEEMQEKLGDENSALIADNFATIISDNLQMNDEMDKKDKEIEQLKQDKENLMNTNMNLLRQIPIKKEEIKKEKIDNNKEEKASNFDYSSVFDENGEFIR